jgi:hypothetical protein
MPATSTFDLRASIDLWGSKGEHKQLARYFPTPLPNDNDFAISEEQKHPFLSVQTTTRTRHSTGFPREDIEPYVTILHNDAHGRSQLAVRSRMRRGSLSGAIDSTACANLR